jgi:hypothetical protein
LKDTDDEEDGLKGLSCVAHLDDKKSECRSRSFSRLPPSSRLPSTVRTESLATSKCVTLTNGRENDVIKSERVSYHAMRIKQSMRMSEQRYQQRNRVLVVQSLYRYLRDTLVHSMVSAQHSTCIPLLLASHLHRRLAISRVIWLLVALRWRASCEWVDRCRLVDPARCLRAGELLARCGGRLVIHRCSGLRRIADTGTGSPTGLLK